MFSSTKTQLHYKARPRYIQILTIIKITDSLNIYSRAWSYLLFCFMQLLHSVKKRVIRTECVFCLDECPGRIRGFFPDNIPCVSCVPIKLYLFSYNALTLHAVVAERTHTLPQCSADVLSSFSLSQNFAFLN